MERWRAREHARGREAAEGVLAEGLETWARAEKGGERNRQRTGLLAVLAGEGEDEEGKGERKGEGEMSVVEAPHQVSERAVAVEWLSGLQKKLSSGHLGKDVELFSVASDGKHLKRGMSLHVLKKGGLFGKSKAKLIQHDGEHELHKVSLRSLAKKKRKDWTVTDVVGTVFANAMLGDEGGYADMAIEALRAEDNSEAVFLSVDPDATFDGVVDTLRTLTDNSGFVWAAFVNIHPSTFSRVHTAVLDIVPTCKEVCVFVESFKTGSISSGMSAEIYTAVRNNVPISLQVSQHARKHAWEARAINDVIELAEKRLVLLSDEEAAVLDSTPETVRDTVAYALEVSFAVAIDSLLDFRIKNEAEAEAYNRIAVLLTKCGRFDPAEKIYRAVIDFHGTKAPLFAKNNLAILLMLGDGYAEAASLLEQCVGAIKGRKGSEDQLAVMYTNLAFIYEQMGKFDKAVEALRKVVSTRIDELGVKDHEIAKLLNHVGVLEMKRGNLSKAREAILEALDILESIDCPDDDPKIAEAVENLATVYDMQRHKDSSPQKALNPEDAEAAAAADKKHHLALAQTLMELAQEYKHQEAAEDLERGLNLVRENLGAAHPDVGKYEKDMLEIQSTADESPHDS
ncbi:Kinesin light chain (KLC) [Durusdinium trenchii]|uniref:Kinesin light chain (KLC) n=1 Tax=Durusdinium trenchii TaxID=1381693 RepID=A0ABP0KFH6_9DINO